MRQERAVRLGMRAEVRCEMPDSTNVWMKYITRQTTIRFRSR